MSAPVRIAIYTASPVMRTLLASAFAGDADCVVLETGLLIPSGPSGGTTGPAASRLRPEVLVFDIDESEPLQRNRAIALRRSRALPSLIFVAGLSSATEALLTREGFNTVRRRPDIRRFTTDEGRAPIIDLFHALARHGSDTPSPGTGPASYGGDTRRTGIQSDPPTRNRLSSAPEATPGTPPSNAPSRSSRPVSPMIVIGASTGGPQAVRCVLEDLPTPLSAPVAIVQHISEGFADGFVRWLRDTTYLNVEIARSGTPLRANTIFVAPSGMHLVVNWGALELRGGEKEQYQRPSADVLFRTAAAAYGPRLIAILLTGMGRDGADGCRVVRERGGVTLVQDEETSVVYGMPRAAAEMGAATEILPLGSIGRRAGALLERMT